MKKHYLVLGAAAAISVGALAAGMVELRGGGTAVSSALTPVVTQTTAATSHLGHHGHHRWFRGFSGSFEVDRPSGVVTWSWVRGTLQSLTTSSVTVVEPDGVTFTAALGSNVRFRGLSEAVAQSARGVRVLVVERDGSVVAMRFPGERSRSTLA